MRAHSIIEARVSLRAEIHCAGLSALAGRLAMHQPASQAGLSASGKACPAKAFRALQNSLVFSPCAAHVVPIYFKKTNGIVGFVCCGAGRDTLQQQTCLPD